MHNSSPRVTLLSTQTIDGKIAMSGDHLLLEPDQYAAWQGLRPAEDGESIDGRNEGVSLIEGAGSFVTAQASIPDWPALATEANEPSGGAWATRATGVDPDSWMPSGLAERVRTWFVIVDGGPRVPWEFVGDEGCHLLVLTSAASTAEHRAFLRRMAIPYLVIGERRVSLPRALQVLRQDLGITELHANCGGDLGAALLALDLVDAVDLVIVPAIVAGEQTPTIADGPLPLAHPARFALLDVQRRGQLVHLRYERTRPGDAA